MTRVERIRPVVKLNLKLWCQIQVYVIIGMRTNLSVELKQSKQRITAPNNRNNIIIKNCGSFTDCISETNNTQIDNAKYVDVVMPKYNLIEYSDNYSTTSECLWQY